MSNWQPQQDGIQQIIQVLANLQTEDPVVHAQISKALEEFKKIPEYNRYLVYIFIHLEKFVQVRICAGLLLKNNVRERHSQIDTDELLYLREEVVKGMADPDANIRRTSAGVITTIVGAFGVSNWNGLIEFLIHCLDTNNATVMDGAFYTLSLLCEDHPLQLEKEDGGKPLHLILPKLLGFYNHSSVEFRNYSISCILKVMVFFPNFMIIHMEQFLKYFFCLASDPDLNIKKKTQIAFINLISTPLGINTVTPYLKDMVKYMVFCLSDSELMMSSCEFFQKVLNYERHYEVEIEPVLDQIVPILFVHLKYTEEELAEKGNINEEDSHIADTNVKPMLGMQNKDEDDDDLDDNYSQTCRKSAAETLDYLARYAEEIFLEILLPLIESGLANPDWLIRESAILALGCVAFGQYRAMIPHLPGLVPYLFTLSRDPKPLIRSITCWVLSRYVYWIKQQGPDANGKTLFEVLLEELLIRVEDKNKEVQKGACSALATISETAPNQIIPYAEVIFVQFHKAMNTFQRKNLISLYDAIGAICLSMKSHFNSQKYMELLMPPLIHKIESLPDDDNELFPLLDCFRSISIAIGLDFAPYVMPVFKRCIKLIENSIVGFTCSHLDPTCEPPEREFLVCSLDMISALCDALKENFGSVVRESKLVALLNELCVNFSDDDNVDFSQSCFAVIGDLARNCGNELVPILPTVIPALLDGCNRTKFVEMCNNSLWAFGEILMFLSPEKPYNEFPTSLNEYMPQFLNSALHLLHVQDDSETEELFETAGVAIGRACFVSPAQMVSTMDSIMGRFLYSLLHLADGLEKEQALQGLCLTIFLQPSIVQQDFVKFCSVIGLWNGENTKLIHSLGSLMNNFRSSLGPRWDEYLNEIDETYYQNYDSSGSDGVSVIRKRIEFYLLAVQ